MCFIALSDSSNFFYLTKYVGVSYFTTNKSPTIQSIQNIEGTAKKYLHDSVLLNISNYSSVYGILKRGGSMRVHNVIINRPILVPNEYTVMRILKYDGGEHSSMYLILTAKNKPEPIPVIKRPPIRNHTLSTN